MELLGRILSLVPCIALLFAPASPFFHANAPADEDYVVARVEGTVAKVCQLVGDFDKEQNQSTISLTYTRYGVAGTDLGVSFEHGDKLVFLFGDTVGKNAYQGLGKDDSFAYTFDETAEDGLNLTFYVGAVGEFLPPVVQNVSQGPFEVPMEGVDVNGTAYVYFTANHTEEKKMGCSVIAKLNDATLTFTFLYILSTEKFINVHVAMVNNSVITGLPETAGQGLLIWGSGEYRASDPYLAYMPLELIENKPAIKYFAGLDNSANPLWSDSESGA